MLFFYLSKIIPLLFFPYPLSLIVLTIVCIKMPAGWLRKLVRLTLICLLLLSWPPLANLLILPLENAYPKQPISESSQADVIVALAGMLRSSSEAETFEQPEFTGAVDRILAAEKLLLMKKAPLLVISGSSGLLNKGDFSEAALLKEWLVKKHPQLSSRIQAEEESRNTAQSAQALASLARTQTWRKILLVTSAYHMPRSVLCFQKQGLEVIPVSVDWQGASKHYWPESAFPSLGGLSLSTLALREYLGLAAYWLRGYL